MSQVKIEAVPATISYSQEDFKPITQTWDIAQDRRGVMYFAGSGGLLEFDGKNWNRFTLPNNSVVRSVLAASDGKIYLGGFEEFGYLLPNVTGMLTYHSLADQVPEQMKGYADVWKIYQVGEQIVFQTVRSLLILDNDKISGIEPDEIITGSFHLEDQIYFQEKAGRLLKWQSNIVTEVDLSGNSGPIQVRYIMPFSKDTSLVVAHAGDLFLLSDENLTKWEVPGAEFIRQYQVSNAYQIAENYYAFGTVQNGLIIIDHHGAIVQLLNEDIGLNNNTILCSFLDAHGNFWIGTNLGIEYIELNSPISVYHENLGMKSSVYTSVVYDGKLYIGTNRGLMYQDWPLKKDKNGRSPDFKMVRNTEGQVWNVDTLGGHLICGHNEGTFIVKDDEARQISDFPGGWKFVRIKNKPGFYIQGTYNSLLIYKLCQDGLCLVNQVEGFYESSRIVAQDVDGSFWVSHPYKGIYHFDLNDDMTQVQNLKFYDAKDSSYPSNVYLYNLGAELIFSATEGIYKWDKKKEAFFPDAALNEVIGLNHQISQLKVDQYGFLTYLQDDRYYKLSMNDDGTFTSKNTFFKKADAGFIGGFEHTQEIDSNHVIIGTSKGFIHYDPRFGDELTFPVTTLIREVRSVTGERDSLLYAGGDILSSSDSGVHTEQEITRIPFQTHALSFEYVTPIFQGQEETQYQYYMEGFDQAWSAWSSKTRKEYTNIPPGNYTFRVRAKSVYEIFGEEAQYAFVILTPWYRSPIAKGVYTVFILVCLFLVVKKVKLEFSKQEIRLRQEKELLLEKKQDEFNRKKEADEKLMIQLKNEKLRAEMAKQHTELASYAMQIAHKNVLLKDLRNQLSSISEKVNTSAQALLKKLIRDIEGDLTLDKDWDNFKVYFNNVHGDFLERIKARYPDLTSTDLKLCAYVRMKLSSKEIATLTNNSIRGVEKGRYRIRKKLGLDQGANLNDFILEV
ncbi:MAG: triple tyrosine motif-containing protein [Cytophagales bacterium]|nr:triple tyrosine motif-containing protein [Cytophagales bacterium]